jgi:hypothetical protein
MITDIEPGRMLIEDCTIAGERKADGVFPAHPSGIPLSRDRWLVLYATRALRGHDDDHSIVYQLRAGDLDGPVLKEGLIDRALEDFDPDGTGRRVVRRSRHPMAFGVPLGAVIGGRPAPHANVFAVHWCVEASGELDPLTGNVAYDPQLANRSHTVMECQFRLNDARDDIEILRPPRPLRQAGFECGPAFCSVAEARIMIQSLVPPVPYNADCTEWAVINDMGDAGLAALKFRFNAGTGLYDWVETGPGVPGTDRHAFSEGSLVGLENGWLVCIRARRKNAGPPDWSGGTARDRGDTAWIRTADPFRDMPAPVVVQDPNRQGPVTAYRCADGVVRIFSGDFTHSPYGQRRDPLYCWDVNPGDFSVANRRVIFDSVAFGAFADDKTPRSTCFAYLYAHTGGATQAVANRVMCFRYRPGVDQDAPPVTPAQFAAFGIHCGRMRFDRAYPATWRYEEQTRC